VSVTVINYIFKYMSTESLCQAKSGELEEIGSNEYLVPGIAATECRVSC